MPSIEEVLIEDKAPLEVRLSKLPFYTNFADKFPGVRFPNPVDARNRQDFERGESADLSKDPFETRVLMNGLQISKRWPMDYKARPPFFDSMRDGDIEKMMNDYFPGINLYPQLRSPAGSDLFFGEHWGYLVLDLFDAEGLLALGEELRSDHVMALIRWQLLDFQDIVFIHPFPVNHDEEIHESFRWKKIRPDHQFIVIPVHVPQHWAVGIYHRATRRLGVVDTHPSKRARDWSAPRIRDICIKLLRRGLPDFELKGGIESIRVPVTPQQSSTNCGWQIAHYVSYFFRENRGSNNWEFTDWVGSNLCREIPIGLTKEEAMVQLWMFAIRSELNGTGMPVRGPINCPVIKFDAFRNLSKDDKLLSQEDLIGKDLHSPALLKAHSKTSRDRLPTEAAVRSIAERFDRIDLRRPIDHRVSRGQSLEIPPTVALRSLSIDDTARTVRATSLEAPLGLHRDLSRNPPPLPQLDGAWSLNTPDLKLSDRRVKEIQSHNRDFHRWVDTSRATSWVPMPAIFKSHQSWRKVMTDYAASRKPTSSQEQINARNLRAEKRDSRRMPDQ